MLVLSKQRNDSTHNIYIIYTYKYNEMITTISLVNIHYHT